MQGIDIIILKEISDRKKGLMGKEHAMKTFDYVITDPDGIHARPAGLFVKEASKYTSNIQISKNGRTGDAKRLFSVMGLAVKKGETVSVLAEGADEDTAIAAMEAFMKANL